MSLEKELEQALTKLVKRDVSTFIAKVISVDKQNGTCKVEDQDLEFTVRLASVITPNKNKFYLFPKVGSEVLISPIEEDIHQLFVDQYSQIEQLNLTIDSSELIMDSQGFNFRREHESLRSLILELIKAIRSMKFTTNMGPTIKLVNEADFTTLENKFKNLLKEI
jgi:hypothetical protein